MLSTNFGTEYEVEMFCPNCGSDDVVLGLQRNGFFDVHSCNRCKFIKKD